MTTQSNPTECACCGNDSNVWHKLATLFDRARVGFEDTDNAPVCDSCWAMLSPNQTADRIRSRRSQPEPKREGPSEAYLSAARVLLEKYPEATGVAWWSDSVGPYIFIGGIEHYVGDSKGLWSISPGSRGRAPWRRSRSELLATPDRTRAPEPWTPKVGDRVVVTNGRCSGRIGVVDVADSDNTSKVNFGAGGTMWFANSDLALCAEGESLPAAPPNPSPRDTIPAAPFAPGALVMVASPEHPRANGQEMEFLAQHGDMYKLRELEDSGEFGAVCWNLPAATTQLTPSESVRAKYPGSHADRCEFCHDRLNGDNHAGPKLRAKYHRECVGQAIRQGIARMAENARARRAAEPPKPDPYSLDKTGRPRDEAIIHEATAMADADAWAKLSIAEKRERQRRTALAELKREVPSGALVTWPESWESPTYGSDH